METGTIILIGILLAIYNGQFLTNKTKAWHITGWWIRALLLIPIWPNFMYMIIYINIAWTAYDIIINLYLKQKWWYQGKTAWIDKTIPFSVLWAIKFVLFIIMIAEIWKH